MVKAHSASLRAAFNHHVESQHDISITFKISRYPNPSRCWVGTVRPAANWTQDRWVRGSDSGSAPQQRIMITKAIYIRTGLFVENARTNICKVVTCLLVWEIRHLYVSSVTHDSEGLASMNQQWSENARECAVTYQLVWHGQKLIYIA